MFSLAVNYRNQVERPPDEADMLAAQRVRPVSSRCRPARLPAGFCPAVIRRSPAITFISVDLPEPDGPMIAVNSCRYRSTDITQRVHRITGSP